MRTEADGRLRGGTGGGGGSGRILDEYKAEARGEAANIEPRFLGGRPRFLTCMLSGTSLSFSLAASPSASSSPLL